MPVPTHRPTFERTLATTLLIAAVLVAGCELITPREDRVAATSEAVAQTVRTGAPAPYPETATVDATDTPEFTPVYPQADVVEGTGEFVKPDRPGTGRSDTAEDGAIILNFQGTDIHEVVKAVLGNLLNLNYVIDPSVSGVVNTDTSGGLSRDDLLPVLETLLGMNGAALVVDSNGLHRIIPKSRALKGTTSPYSSALARMPGYGVQIVPLRYIAVAEMQKILAPFVEEQNLVFADERRNILMLAGTLDERRNLHATVEVFDVDWMKGMSVGLYPLNYVEPKMLIEELQQALGGEGGKILDGLVRLIAIDRLNALLVVTPRANALEETRTWIERLDRTGTQSGRRLFVHHVQNAKAVDLAGILNEIFADSGGGGVPPVSLAPGTTAVQMGTGAPGAAPGDDYASSMFAGDDIRIIADEVNNALVILATPQEFEIIESAIRKLDIMPLQVLIEATIVEVTLSDSLEYGVEWFFKNNVSTNKTGRGLLDLGATGLSTFAPAFSYALVDGADDVRVVLNMLASENKLNVLSSPSLMVLDNQTAYINVGDEIPIPTRQSTSNLDSVAPTVNEIVYRNTGVSLSVTPRVNAGGLVTMEVEQEVSDAVPTTSSDLNAPTIQQRHVTTVVAVHSGETVILGGLIRDTVTQNESGIPFLYKIPFIGKLFGQTTDSSRRTELLILITPRAVTNKAEARSITAEFRNKLNAVAPRPTE